MQELYELGARKLGIINVGPVGCVPRVRVLNATGGCADGMNQLAAGFDAALESLLAGLAAELLGMAYSLADSFGFAALTDPLAAGFVSADSARGSYITSGRYISYVSIKTIKVQIGFNIFIKIVQHLEIMDSTFF